MLFAIKAGETRLLATSKSFREDRVRVRSDNLKNVLTVTFSYNDRALK